MTSPRWVVGIVGCSVLVACGGDDGSPVEVRDPWARTTATGATVGAIYVELESAGDDTLRGVTVDDSVAAEVVLHATTTGDDAMSTMDPIDGVDLPAGELVNLAPNGTHVMLEDLAAPLVAGATFEATLQFAEAPDQTITVTVLDDAP